MPTKSILAGGLLALPFTLVSSFVNYFPSGRTGHMKLHCAAICNNIRFVAREASERRQTPNVANSITIHIYMYIYTFTMSSICEQCKSASL